MSTTMTVPVTISPEASAFVEQLGQREELDLMLDRAKHIVPGSYGDRRGAGRGNRRHAGRSDSLDIPRRLRD